jgi:transposase
MDLTQSQWNFICQFLPMEELEPSGGRPWADARKTFNGVLWILRTGAPWKDLPARYGAPATVHRRFQSWQEQGLFRRLLETLARDLEMRGRLDLSECFIDGTFIPAKKGALVLAKLNAAKARNSWESSTLMALLSPCALKTLHPPK